MFRLLLLLARQGLMRRQPVQQIRTRTSHIFSWHWPRITIATTALCVLAVGLAAFIYANRNAVRPACQGAPNAALELHIDEMGSAPVVAYLEIPGASMPQINPPSETVRIVSSNSSFQPTFQVAPIAANIQVSNDDAIAHNTHVFDGSRTLFNMALPSAGVHVHKSLGRVGIFDVRCDLHPWMRAWIFVPPPNGHHATVWQKGSVTLSNLAAGEYQLHIWTPSRGETAQALHIEPGQTKLLRLALP